MVPNADYSGPVKPHLSEFEELPFTSGSAEFNVLRQGGLDYGYLPTEDISQAGYLTSHGYTVTPWVGWSINYIPLNMTNPTSGPIFKQLYFRQALQHLVDQKGIVNNILKGYGYPDYGPIPPKPANGYVDSSETTNGYPYSPSAAKAILKSHGWSVVPNGVSICQDPGAGPGECGAGIAKGAQASFSMLYTSGQLSLQQEMEVFQGDLSLAGIKLKLTSAPYDSVLSDALPCSVGKSCGWDMAYWGNGWVYAPYPSGEIMFASGGGYNVGGYKSPTNDKNIEATLTSGAPDVVRPYENYLAQQLPVLWFPVPDYQISVYKRALAGVAPQDPGLTIDPATWSLTK
jgi:peptide/nickel transport system substrate-binding protein